MCDDGLASCVLVRWNHACPPKDLDQESQRRAQEVEDLQKRLSQAATDTWPSDRESQLQYMEPVPLEK